MGIRSPALIALMVLAAVVAGGCSSGTDSEAAIPAPTCVGGPVGIPGALPCERVAELAIDALRAEAPEQLERRATGVVVELSRCPAGEMPPQVDCTGVSDAWMVRLSFGPAPSGGPIEDQLTVALEPVTGRLLGIVNPLVR